MKNFMMIDLRWGDVFSNFLSFSEYDLPADNINRFLLPCLCFAAP